MPGDADGDGKVTPEDARLILRASVGPENCPLPPDDPSPSVFPSVRLIARISRNLHRLLTFSFFCCHHLFGIISADTLLRGKAKTSAASVMR